MTFVKNIFFEYVKRYFPIINKRNWEWTYDYPYSKSQLIYWNTLKNDFIKVNFDKNKIWLRTKKELKKGWYLFCIFHYGQNRFTFGSFKNGKYGFKQSRLVSSGKKRFRILRILEVDRPIICLSNLQYDLEIKDLMLLPIPSFYAWIRIKSRLEDFKKEFKISFKNYPAIWRFYNKALAATVSKVKITTYSSWLEIIENPFLKSNQKNNKDYSSYFSLQKRGRFDYVEDLDWVMPIKENDRIPGCAYYFYYDLIKKRKDCLIIYADEDFIDSAGKRYNPNFKTGWNREFFLSNPNFGNAWVISSKIWNKALKISAKFDKMQDFNIVVLNSIYLSETLAKNKKFIFHLPIICYHSFKESNNELLNLPDVYYSSYLYGLIATKWSNLGNIEDIEINKSNTGYKFSWAVPKTALLSIIIPTKDNLPLLKKCVESIFNKKCGLNFEIILIDNKSENSKTFTYYDFLKNNFKKTVKILEFNEPFNYSKINNYAFKFSKGEVLLFLNNDVEFISEKWGIELYSNAIRPEIGFVGSKLLYPNQTIQHAGIILGIDGTAGHAHKYFHSNNNGYQNRISLSQEISAVTGACMAISRNRFCEIGMFDDKFFKVNFNDVDLCLRAMKLGLKNLYIPDVIAIHHESATRSITKDYQSLNNEFEKMMLKKRWQKLLQNDPYYSPYLTLLNEDFSLSLRKNLKSNFDSEY